MDFVDVQIGHGKKHDVTHRIALVNNFLNGTIPNEIQALAALEVLDFSENYLSGTIPATLGELSLLHTFRCTRNLLSGTVAEVLGSVSSLQDLVVSTGRLYFCISQFAILILLLDCSLLVADRQ